MRRRSYRRAPFLPPRAPLYRPAPEVKVADTVGAGVLTEPRP